jgi:hypothetical protein
LLARTGRDRSRPLVFLVVLLAHGVVAILLIRERSRQPAPAEPPSPLILMYLNTPSPTQERRSAESKPAVSAVQGRKTRDSNQGGKAPDAAAAIQNIPMPPAPKIDWAHEASLAVASSVAKAEIEKTYRNLAGLSQAQLEWLMRNRFEPMPPEFQWDHAHTHRIESEDGMPIVWINDHCVLVMFIIPLCNFGHDEPKGDLFKHMRDPKPP